MTKTERKPTTIAECGCPYDPEYDEGHVGWHLRENHPEFYPTVEESHGHTWVSCVGGAAAIHHFRVNQHFVPGLTGPTHLLVCDVCGMHLHADFEIKET